MTNKKPKSGISRREFVKKGVAAGIGTSALTAMAQSTQE